MITIGEIRKAIAPLADTSKVRLCLAYGAPDGLTVEFYDAHERHGELIITGEAFFEDVDEEALPIDDRPASGVDE